MEDRDVKLTPEMLKALGENTKAMILKELSRGPRTPTDIGRRLDKSTPTIVEHLDKLVNSGLVERIERPGKKYVFYALTETSKELIFNKSRISIVLYGSIALFAVGALLLGAQSYLNLGVYSAAAIPAVTNSATPAVATVGAYTYNTVARLPASSIFLALYVASIIILILAFVLLFVYLRKRKQIDVGISD
jgi:DNA-binding transcriptional ArsR family regulator